MVQRKTWKEFQEAKLLWWINMVLHTFGWALVLVQEEDGSISDAYPARVKFRGFDEQSNDEGYIGLTKHINDNMKELLEEAK